MVELHRRAARRRGLTMLETLSVILIGMIVSVIGISGARILNRRQPVKSVASRFSSALSTARSFSVARNGFFQVVLDLDGARFWIDEIENPIGPSGNFPSRPKIVAPETIDERVGAVSVLETGATEPAISGLEIFVFNPDGSSSRDARIFFSRSDDDLTPGGTLFTVRLWGPTGHNRINAGGVPPTAGADEEGDPADDPIIRGGNRGKSTPNPGLKKIFGTRRKGK